MRENVLDDTQTTPLSPVAAWTGAVCAVRRSCCGPDPDALYALASCEADLSAALDLQAGFEEGQLRVDESILAGCMAAANAAIGCTSAVPDFAPCRGALKGTVSEGGVCRNSFECARGADGQPAICAKALVQVSDYSVPSPTGSCRPSPLEHVGDACALSVGSSLEAADWSGPAEQLAMSGTKLGRCSREQGLFCSSNGTCAALGARGDACADSTACGPGLVCGCRLCQDDAGLSASLLASCVDGACLRACPRPQAAPGREYCTEAVDPSDGQCRVAQLACGYAGDCPATWEVARSPSSCNGGGGSFVLGSCGDTFTWKHEYLSSTCHYDMKSGQLVGVKETTDVADTFCFGSSPSHFERLAGHVPATCATHATADATIACSAGCDGGADGDPGAAGPDTDGGSAAAATP